MFDCVNLKRSKDSASREKYKMNLFIFNTEAQPIFIFLLNKDSESRKLAS